MVDDDRLDFITKSRKELSVSVRGIPYEGRAEIAGLIKVGDELVLELDSGNIYDFSFR